MSVSEGTLFRWPGSTRRVLLAGFLLPLALDFRKIGDSTDSSFQILLVVVAFFCGALYFMIETLSGNRRRYRSALVPVSCFWWLFIFLSPLPVIFLGVDIGHYLRVLLPIVLFGAGLVVMVAVERRRVNPTLLLDLLFWGAFFSMFWRAFYTVSVAGLSVDTMRWQILSPSTPYVLGYGAACLYLGRRQKIAVVALAAAVVVVLLSVTRSYLLTATAIFGGLLLVESRRHTAARAVLSAVRVTAVLSLAGVTAAAVTAVARPGFLEIWAGRLFDHSARNGLDITLVTRLAELRGQANAILTDASTVLIGHGIGADYTWDYELLGLLAFEVDDSARWFGGHSSWLYPFFSSGIFIGSIVPLVFLTTLFKGLSAASRRSRNPVVDDAVLAFIIYAGYLGSSFTVNLLNERYGALILGVVTGAILIYAKSIERHRVTEGSVSLNGRLRGRLKAAQSLRS